MDKRILNKEVVLMRKHAKKARVHVISKLVREASRLKNKNGSVEHKEKNERKAHRLIEEVIALKTFKDDDITKFALNETRKLETILGDVNIQLQTKALAKVATNENISAHVIKFRQKYPSWKEAVPSLLQNLGTKVKKKESGARNKGTQKKSETTGIYVQRDSNDNNGNQVDDENFEETDSDQINAVGDDQSDDDQVVGTTYNIVNQEKIKKIPKQSLTSKKLLPSNGHKFTPLIGNAKNIKEIKLNIAEVKKFTELLEDQSKTCEHDNSNSGDIMNDDVLTRISDDPFFILEGGYGSSDLNAGIDNLSLKQHSTDNPSNENFNRKRKIKQGPNRSERRQMLGISQPHRRNFQSSQLKPALKESCFIKTQGNVIKKNVKETPLYEKKPKSVKGPEGPVHPSWEAKRKLKELQTTVAFQGTKIKFDD